MKTGGIFEPLASPLFWRDCVSEFLCCLILMTIATFSLVTLNEEHYKVNTTAIGLLVGFLVMLLIEGSHHIGGANLNPIATLVWALDGRIPYIKVFFYLIAQCAGGAGGSAIAYACVSDNIRSQFFAFRPNSEITVWQGVAIEAVLSFNLVFTALGATDAKRRPVYIPGLPVGMAIGVGIMAAGTYTGATMNPIVALGPAVITGNFKDHWVYWLGPYSGALLAYGVYAFFMFIQNRYGKPKQEDSTLKNKAKREELMSLLADLVDDKKTNLYEDNEKLSSV